MFVQFDRLTALGRELLHDLLADLPADLAGDDAEFLTRLGQFEQLTTDWPPPRPPCRCASRPGLRPSRRSG
ncbi:hypothetical protein KZZ52_46315 [Dactylosporangium sp. AC04546]|uniref:hypothetical protein n=1 Tax=Dactylosporangium sp. AC04546 TaxID=2862460 RepID=UPI001EDEF1A8|nr:hypothetical protein [Dactylosporangium sp. AC04546]WVK81330.1 hypothetical protein KZZ52_46315 [Dactylosporangium sp. AC04546]